MLELVPPSAVDAEQAILGSVLITEKQIEMLDLLTAVLSVEDFYQERHRNIFAAMLELGEAKVQIDAVTLTDMLKSKEQLEGIGGVAYLAELADAVPTSSSALNYSQIVWQKARYREFISTVRPLLADAYRGDLSLDAFIGEADSRIGKVFENANRMRDVVPRDQRIQQAANMLLYGVPADQMIQVGFPLLDSKVWLMPGDLVTLAAETSLGKTTIAGNMALNVAQSGKGVIFFTYEMSEEQLNQRLMCSLREIPAHRGEWGHYDEINRGRIAEASAALAELPLTVVWARGYRQKHIRTEMRRRRLALDAPLRLVVVDYLQLMKSDRQNRNRDQDYDDIVAALKDFAGEFGCAILLLSQFNREATRRGNEKQPPRVSDVKGSSAIEQYSDGIWFLWQPEKEFPTKVELQVAKNRNGGRGKIPLLHVPEYLRFEPRRTHGY